MNTTGFLVITAIVTVFLFAPLLWGWAIIGPAVVDHENLPQGKAVLARKLRKTIFWCFALYYIPGAVAMIVFKGAWMMFPFYELIGGVPAGAILWVYAFNSGAASKVGNILRLSALLEAQRDQLFEAVDVPSDGMVTGNDIKSAAEREAALPEPVREIVTLIGSDTDMLKEFGHDIAPTYSRDKNWVVSPGDLPDNLAATKREKYKLWSAA